jgi:hypothetical protein
MFGQPPELRSQWLVWLKKAMSALDLKRCQNGIFHHEQHDDHVFRRPSLASDADERCGSAGRRFELRRDLVERQ